MLSRRIMRQALRVSQLHQATTFRSTYPSLIPMSHRYFSKDESNFDGHSDFEPKSKTSGEDAMSKQISEWISSNDVCLFMKGNRKMPRCGFSNYVVQIFKFYGVKEIKDINVLEDETLRETIKVYSNWPTIPQVYIKGNFVGGCDIMKEMHQDGSLEELLIREGIIKSEVANR